MMQKLIDYVREQGRWTTDMVRKTSDLNLSNLLTGMNHAYLDVLMNAQLLQEEAKREKPAPKPDSLTLTLTRNG